MNNFQKITVMDVSALRETIYKFSSLWVGHPELQEDDLGYSHKDASIILLRYPPMTANIGTDVEEQKKVQENLFSVWLEDSLFFRSTLDPLLYELMEMVGGTHIGGIGIVKLPAGKKIEHHYDEGLCAQFYSRFHITVDDPAECYFICGEGDDKERAVFCDNEVRWFNCKKIHGVVDNGAVIGSRFR